MNEEFEKEQRINKGLWKFDQRLHKAGMVLLVTFYVVVFVMVIFFAIKGHWKQANSGMVVLGALTFAYGVVGFIYFCIKRYFRKDETFTVEQLKLPEVGSVDVEMALHHMTYSVGSIYVDTLACIIVASIVLCTAITKRGNMPVIIGVIIATIVISLCLHKLLKSRWQHRNFTKKLRKYTTKYYEEVKVDTMIQDFNIDLHLSILYYAKEFIITPKYFLGNTCSEMVSMPVLLPRSEIKQITFHRVRKVVGKSRLFQGYLICERIDGEMIEYFIGQYPRYIPTLCVLEHYQILFVEGEDLYK